MHVVEEVLNAEELEWIKALIRRSRFRVGVDSAKGAARQVKLNEQLEPLPQEFQQLVKLLFNALHRNSRFSQIASPLELSVPMINRYAEGMSYGPHNDAPFMPTPDGPRIRSDLAATLFLSNPEDYDGGGSSVSCG